MKIVKKNILIVGGTGFLGYYFAKKCIQKKFVVTSISLNKPIKERKLKSVKYLHFDISKRKSFNKLNNKKFDYVVNFGGHVDHFNKIKTYNSHFVGVKNLVDYFLKKKELKKFIQIGSSAEYGKINSPQKEASRCIPKLTYGKSKFLATNFLLKLNKKKKFPVVILRFYQVFGPKQSFNRLIPIVINSSFKNKSFPCSSGVQKRDFLYVDDAINAIMLTITNEKVLGKIINIGYGKCIEVKKVINHIVNTIKMGKPEYGKIKLRKDEAKVIFPDISRAKNLIKWRPKIKFFYGLNKTIKYYKS